MLGRRERVRINFKSISRDYMLHREIGQDLRKDSSNLDYSNCSLDHNLV